MDMNASRQLEGRLLGEIMRIEALDVHSHVPAHAPFARSLRELLGYHYYTELAHSAGLGKDVLADERADEEVLPALLQAIEAIDNTVQYRWLIELARTLFGFPEERLTGGNWQGLAEAVRRHAGRPGRAREILGLSHIQKTFLTNEFDEDLSRVDADLFVPSLRADTLVFHLHETGVKERIEQASGETLSGPAAVRRAVGALAERFRAGGARSVAISLPPGFHAGPVADRQYDAALQKALAQAPLTEHEAAALHVGTFYAFVQACRHCALPFQMMYGVVRGAYRHGVPHGQDLLVSGDTLSGLLPVLNRFPGVTFCLSVLSETQFQELSAYGWIVQNVVLSGHWWYSTAPGYIERELIGRLQTVPKTKLIGYYSDMYKLEFGLAKMNMYRRVLARVLAGQFVERGYGTEQDALQIAHLLLRGNAERIFGV